MKFVFQEKMEAVILVLLDLEASPYLRILMPFAEKRGEGKKILGKVNQGE